MNFIMNSTKLNSLTKFVLWQVKLSYDSEVSPDGEVANKTKENEVI